jgi:hypothetical protein
MRVLVRWARPCRFSLLYGFYVSFSTRTIIFFPPLAWEALAAGVHPQATVALRGVSIGVGIGFFSIFRYGWFSSLRIKWFNYLPSS